MGIGEEVDQTQMKKELSLWRIRGAWDCKVCVNEKREPKGESLHTT